VTQSVEGRKEEEKPAPVPKGHDGALPITSIGETANTPQGEDSLRVHEGREWSRLGEEGQSVVRPGTPFLQ